MSLLPSSYTQAGGLIQANVMAIQTYGIDRVRVDGFSQYNAFYRDTDSAMPAVEMAHPIELTEAPVDHIFSSDSKTQHLTMLYENHQTSVAYDMPHKAQGLYTHMHHHDPHHLVDQHIVKALQTHQDALVQEGGLAGQGIVYTPSARGAETKSVKPEQPKDDIALDWEQGLRKGISFLEHEIEHHSDYYAMIRGDLNAMSIADAFGIETIDFGNSDYHTHHAHSIHASDDVHDIYDDVEHNKHFIFQNTQTQPSSEIEPYQAHVIETIAAPEVGIHNQYYNVFREAHSNRLLEPGQSSMITMNTSKMDYHYVLIEHLDENGNVVSGEDAPNSSLRFADDWSGSEVLANPSYSGFGRSLLIIDPDDDLTNRIRFKLKNDDYENGYDIQYTWFRVDAKPQFEDDYFLEQWAGLGASNDSHLAVLYAIGDDVNVKQTIKSGLPNFGELVDHADNIGNDLSEHGVFFSVPLEDYRMSLNIDGINIT